MRGVDVVILSITPFQYNPVSKELIVYTDLRIKIDFIGGNGRFGEDRLRNKWWEPILKNHILNYNTLPKINFEKRQGYGWEYIIIIPDDPDFEYWANIIKDRRNSQGISTEVFKLSEIGGNTVSAIENFINDAYYNWDIPPVAVLLLADYPEITTATVSHPSAGECVTDNVYADVEGDDALPDVVVARICAKNATHLSNIIGKMIQQEDNSVFDPTFYEKPLISCAFQENRWFHLTSEIIYGYMKRKCGLSPLRQYQSIGTPPSPGDEWSTAENTDLVVDYFGPSGLDYIPDKIPEGIDWTGGSASGINSIINSGTFLVQHRNHGSETGWEHPSYHISDLSGLNNDRYPFVFSINCLTGKFNLNNECFVEAFHRRSNGALGLFGATEVSFSFVNDAYVLGYYDAMYPDFDPGYPGSNVEYEILTLPAFANASGKYYLQASNFPNNPDKKEITYHLFHHHGDAFISLYPIYPVVFLHFPDPDESEYIFGVGSKYYVKYSVSAGVGLQRSEVRLDLLSGNGGFPVQLRRYDYFDSPPYKVHEFEWVPDITQVTDNGRMKVITYDMDNQWNEEVSNYDFKIIDPKWASWEVVNSGLGNLNINDIAIDPQNYNVVYAATDGGLYKSTDQGGSWSLVNGPWGVSRVLKIEAKENLYDPDITFLYVVTEENNDFYVYRTEDGVNWDTIFSASYEWEIRDIEVYNLYYEFVYVLQVAIDQNNNYHLQIWRGEYQGGGNWDWTLAMGGDIPALGFDAYSLISHPTFDGYLYVGLGYKHGPVSVDLTGVYYTQDRGSFWEHRSNGLVVSNTRWPYVYGLAVDWGVPYAEVCYAAVTDKWSGSGAVWGIYKTMDSGEHWYPVLQGIDPGSYIFAVEVPTINIVTLMDKKQNEEIGIVFAGVRKTGNTGQAVYCTFNGGKTWIKLKDNIGYEITSLCADGDLNYLFVGTKNGGVFRYNLQYIANPIFPIRHKIVFPVGGEVLRIGFDYKIEWEILGGNADVTSQKVYFSKDGGVNYELLGTVPVNRRYFMWMPDVDDITDNGKIKVEIYYTGAPGSPSVAESDIFIVTSQYVLNGGFEEDLAHWQIFGDGVAQIDNQIYYEGARSVRISRSNTGNWFGVVQRWIPAHMGQRLWMKGYIKTQLTQGRAGFGFGLFGEGDVGGISLTESSDWVYRYISWTPDDPSDTVFEVKLHANPDFIGTAWFDDIWVGPDTEKPFVQILEPLNNSKFEIKDTVELIFYFRDDIAVERYKIVAEFKGRQIVVKDFNYGQGKGVIEDTITEKFVLPSDTGKITAYLYVYDAEGNYSQTSVSGKIYYALTDEVTSTKSNTQRKIGVYKNKIFRTYTKNGFVYLQVSNDKGKTWLKGKKIKRGRYPSISVDSNIIVLSFYEVEERGFKKKGKIWVGVSDVNNLNFAFYKIFEDSVPQGVNIMLSPPSVICERDTIHLIFEVAENRGGAYKWTLYYTKFDYHFPLFNLVKIDEEINIPELRSLSSSSMDIRKGIPYVVWENPFDESIYFSYGDFSERENISKGKNPFIDVDEAGIYIGFKKENDLYFAYRFYNGWNILKVTNDIDEEFSPQVYGGKVYVFEKNGKRYYTIFNGINFEEPRNRDYPYIINQNSFVYERGEKNYVYTIALIKDSIPYVIDFLVDSFIYDISIEGATQQKISKGYLVYEREGKIFLIDMSEIGNYKVSRFGNSSYRVGEFFPQGGGFPGYAMFVSEGESPSIYTGSRVNLIFKKNDGVYYSDLTGTYRIYSTSLPVFSPVITEGRDSIYFAFEIQDLSGRKLFAGKFKKEEPFNADIRFIDYTYEILPETLSPSITYDLSGNFNIFYTKKFRGDTGIYFVRNFIKKGKIFDGDFVYADYYNFHSFIVYKDKKKFYLTRNAQGSVYFWTPYGFDIEADLIKVCGNSQIVYTRNDSIFLISFDGENYAEAVYITQGKDISCDLKDDTLYVYYIKELKGRKVLNLVKKEVYVPYLVSGEIENKTLLKDRVYVTGDVIFRDSVEILPGTEIIFYDNDDQRRKDTPYDTTSRYKIDMEFFEYIKAKGTGDDSIHFRGIRSGDRIWDGLYFGENVKGHLSYCTFQNALCGIYSVSKGPLNIENSRFKYNRTGVAVFGAEIFNIRNSRFVNNGVERERMSLESNKIRFREQKIFEKIKGNGWLIDPDSMDGGIWAGGTNLNIYNSYFADNKAWGIIVQNRKGKGYVEIKGSRFENNFHSGVYLVLSGIFRGSPVLKIDSCVFLGHTKDMDGSGVYLITGTEENPNSKGTLLLSRNYFENNTNGIWAGSWISDTTVPSSFDFSVFLYRNRFIRNVKKGINFVSPRFDYEKGLKWYLSGNYFSENPTGIYAEDKYHTYYIEAGRIVSVFSTGFNSFINNEYHIENRRKDTLWAQNNIWSERDSLSIEGRLIDDSDESFYGPVIFKPVAFSGIIKKDTTWTGDIVIGGDVIIEREAKLRVRKANIKVFPYDALFSGIDTERVEIIVKGEFDMKKSKISVIDSTPFGFFGIRSVHGGGEISWLRNRSYRDELSRLGNRSYINDDGLSRLGNRSYGYDDNENSRSRIHTAMKEVYKDNYSGKEAEIKIKKSEIRDALYGLYIEGGEAEIKKSKVLNVNTGIYIKDGELEMKKTEVKSYDYSLFIDGFEEIELKNNKNSFLPYSGYAIYNNTPFDINAERNYFGTSDIDSVEELIFHKPDDSTKGFVDYLPLWIPDGDEKISGIQSKDSEIKEGIISVPVLQVNNLSLLIKGYKRTIIEIYRITGEKILLKKIEDRNRFIRFKTENLPAGVYFVKLKTENRKIRRKIIIIK